MPEMGSRKVHPLRLDDDELVTGPNAICSASAMACPSTSCSTAPRPRDFPGGFLDDLDRNLNVPVYTLNSSGSFVNTSRGATPAMGDTLVIVGDGTYKVGNMRR